MKKVIKLILNLTWCLPQNIIGLLVLIYCKITRKIICKSSFLVNGEVASCYEWSITTGSLSLGHFRFVYNYEKDEQFKGVARHEYGHTIQSYYLGWLYLLVIGLPSVIWAGCFKKYRRKHRISYYDFYTEKSANILGGV